MIDGIRDREMTTEHPLHARQLEVGPTPPSVEPPYPPPGLTVLQTAAVAVSQLPPGCGPETIVETVVRVLEAVGWAQKAPEASEPATATDAESEHLDQIAVYEYRRRDLKITDRELEVLGLLVQGYSNKHVAIELGLSVRTAETHRLNLRRKADKPDKIGLVKLARSLGLTQ